MDERKMMKKILKRIGATIEYSDERTIEFTQTGYESISIVFDEDGKIVEIFS